MIWSIRRLMTDAVARFDARVDQDADPAVLTSNLGRSRRRNPVSRDAAEAERASESEQGVDRNRDPGTVRRGALEPERTETEAQEELARILDAQRRRMRGRRGGATDFR